MIIPTRWTDDDGGRSKSKRPKQKSDCTVTALAIATVTAYDEVYDNLPEPSKEKVLELIIELEKFTKVIQKPNLKRIMIK